MLVVSSCKVRNLIQAQLDIPQTKLTNKNQTTFSKNNCLSLEAIIINHDFETSKSTNYTPFSIVKKDDFIFFSFPLDNSSIRLSKDKDRVSTIPLYLLYKNIQVYS